MSLILFLEKETTLNKGSILLITQLVGPCLPFMQPLIDGTPALILMKLNLPMIMTCLTYRFHIIVSTIYCAATEPV